MSDSTTPAVDDQTPQEAQTRAAQISNVTYDVHVEVSSDASRPTFTSRATLRFDSTGPESYIDFSPESVSSMLLNGAPVPHSAIRDGRIYLDGLAAHNELTLVSEVAYRTNGVGMHRQVDPKDGNVYLYTNCEPFNAHKWLPCFDQPDIKGRLSLSVTAPTDWKIIGNYPLASATPSASDAAVTTTSFEPTPPLSTYLMAMCAGPFEKFERTSAQGLPLGLYVRKSMAPYLDRDFFFDTTEKGLAFYANLFGRPYPFAKYDQILVPEFNSGAMENAGCITFRDDACVFMGKPTESDFGRVAEYILHEMAHMWFGDLVTLKGWEDLWLNESFADLMEKISQDSIMPDSHVWAEFANGRKAWGLGADQLPSSHPVAPEPGPVSRARDNFDGITYAKGGSALRQLIAHVGFDPFFAGVRAYFDAHEWSNATLHDLLSSIEASSGVDLSVWAERWLKTKGPSTITGEASMAADGSYARYTLTQSVSKGDDVTRPHTLNVGCYRRSPSGQLEKVHEIAARFGADDRSIEVPELVGETPYDLVLVNDGDLTYAKVRPDAASTATIASSLGELSDPLARAISWGIEWDMTRDAAIPASTFVATVLANAPHETTISVLEGVLAKASSAIGLYCDPQSRSRSANKLTKAAASHMRTEPEGSDAQLLWARTFIRHAHTQSDLRLIHGLLDGSASIPGLAVDTSLKWDMMEALSEQGATPAMISALEAADGTDIGHRRALTCRAARPAPDAKEAAWNLITTDSTLSLRERQALASGFIRAGQETQIAPFLDRYLAYIDKLWSSDTPEAARALTTALYPTPLVSERVAKAVSKKISQGTLPAGAIKILKDSVDGTQRAIAARAADKALHAGLGH